MLLLVLSGPQPLHAEWSLLDGAKVHPDYHGPVPKKSDVIFSTRFKRDNAAEVARSFGATRIEWVYSTDPEFVRSLQSVAPWFGGALSSTIPLPQDKGIARDFDGNPIIAPWMKSWGAKWITTTDLRTREVLQGIAREYLKLGASSIQIDDPLLQFSAANWSGDFSESSLVGFRSFVLENLDKAKLQELGIPDLRSFDYREFLATQYQIRTAKEYLERYRALPTTPLWLAYLKESVADHFRDFRAYLHSTSERVVPISMNLQIFGPDESKPQFDLVPFLDYAIVETNIKDPDLLSLQEATYRALGIGYVPSILPLTKAENRAAIAMLYALGAQPLVPWDVYINEGPDRMPSRFFGLPEDYGDLYRFVRENEAFFDNYEELAVVGIVAPVNHYKVEDTLALVRRLSKEKVPYAIVPIGGTKRRYILNKEHNSHFRLLLTVNPLYEFTPDDLSMMRRLPVRLVPADEISNELLASYSPFGREGGGRTRLLARGDKERPEKIIVHVLRSTEERNDALPRGCDHRVSFRHGFDITESINAAMWHTLSGVKNLPIARSITGLSIEIPDCDEWGMLELARK